MATNAAAETRSNFILAIDLQKKEMFWPTNILYTTELLDRIRKG
jgi:hypothetical protein